MCFFLGNSLSVLAAALFEVSINMRFYFCLVNSCLFLDMIQVFGLEGQGS